MSTRAQVGRAGLVLLLLASVLAVASRPRAVQAAASCRDPGSDVPVLFVHGFDDYQEVWNPNAQWGISMKEVVDGVRGTFTDLFDYGPASREWVTDKAIGPALAARIDCLAKASRRHGGPGEVIVVAHSMGGLATRDAANRSVEGRRVASRIALLVEIGTPHLGSAPARFGVEFAKVTKGVEASRALAKQTLPPALARFYASIVTAPASWYAGCPQADASSSRLFSICYLRHLLADLPSTSAVQALASGEPVSEQLRELPTLDRAIPVLAIAGRIDVTTSIFTWKVPLFSLGDIVVGEDSTTKDFIRDGAKISETDVRDVAAHPDAGGGTVVQACHALEHELLGIPPVSGQPPVRVNPVQPCWHRGLPRSPDVVAKVKGSIQAYMRQLRPVTSIDWNNARYTTNCVGLARRPFTVQVRNRTGQVRGGGRDDYDRYEILVEAFATGDLTGDSKPEAAVMLYCSGQPSNFYVEEVQVFTAGPKLLTELPNLDPQATLGPVFDPYRFSIRDRRIVTGAWYYAANDSHASGPSTRRIHTWRWSGEEFVRNTDIPLFSTSDLARFPVTLDGIGPLRVGMTLSEVESAVDARISVEYISGSCGHARPAGALEGLTLMFLNDRLARIDVERPAQIATHSGIRIGSTEADVRRAYPGQLTVQPHPHDPTRRYFVVTPKAAADADRRLVFETDERAVTSYRTGQRDATQLTEGCA